PATAVPEREETHVRLAALARRAGDEGAAEQELERALAETSDSAAALDMLIELYDSQARWGELAEALGRRARADLAPGARADLLRRHSAALERAGRVGEAAALCRSLCDTD